MEPPSTSSGRNRPKRLRPRPPRWSDREPSPAPAPGRRLPLTGIFIALASLLAVGYVCFSVPAAAQNGGGGDGGGAGAPLATGFDPGSVGTSLLLVLALTLLNAVFAMAETALVSVRRSRVEQLVDEGSRAARVVKRLIENPPRFIATVQVGITLLGFAAAAAAATTLAAPMVPLFRTFLPGGAADTAAVILVTVLVAFVSMVLGEIVPKSLAVQAPDAWALRLAPLVNFFATLLAPINWLVITVSNLIVRPFGARAQFESPVITEEELKQIIEAGEEAGELEEDEKEMLHNVFDLGETLVRSVMTPRIEMTAVPVESDLGTILQTIMTSGHSRIPLYEGTTDRIVGIVHAKDLLPIFHAEEHDVELRRVMRAPYFVPETKRVSDLLAEFRRSNQQLAVVQDEYAGTEGIVTIEDLLEEIVGDIRDEYDVDEPEVQVLSATESLVDGRMSIDDVNDRLGTALPHEEYETIGGLVFGLLGHEPMPGDRVRHDGLEFLVEHVEGRRIRTLRAVKVGTLTDGNGADAALPSFGEAAGGAPRATVTE